MNKESKNCVWIGIGSDIDSSSQLHKSIIKINNILNTKYNGVLKLSRTNRPQLNLYDLEVPEENTDKVIGNLKTVLNRKKYVEASIRGLNYFKFGIFYLELENSLDLQDLHRSIVEAVSKFKENCLCEDYLKPWRNYKPEQERMLKKYGNPFVMDQYFPHITLGLLKNYGGNLENIKNELQEIITDEVIEIKDIQLVQSEERDHNIIQSFELR